MTNKVEVGTQTTFSCLHLHFKLVMYTRKNGPGSRLYYHKNMRTFRQKNSRSCVIFESEADNDSQGFFLPQVCKILDKSFYT